MVDVLASSAVDCEFEPRTGQTKDYNIGICVSFSAKQAALRIKSKYQLAWNQDNASEWKGMSTREMFFN
jgi:hypothetical protein